MNSIYESGAFDLGLGKDVTNEGWNEIRRQINELSAEEDAGIREILLEALRIQGHDVN